MSTKNATSPQNPQMVLVDDFAYHWPYPVFCNPADNNGVTGNVNWACYNALSVGSSQHINSNHYVWASHSSCVNPSPEYGSVPDREMPYVLAPGMWPYEVVDNPDCGYDLHAPSANYPSGYKPVGFDFEAALKTPLNHGWMGTSLAAPTANGIAACVISANPGAFSSWPEKVRLAMILTAQNCDGVEWNCNIDGRDGAGTISGSEAESFAMNHTPVYPDNSACFSGLCASAWGSSDYTSKKFNILIANRPVGKHLRIVLTWDSKPYLPAAQNFLSDLDLSCFNGYQFLWSSTSYNGNVEVVDIPRSSLSTGQTIQAYINPFTMRFHPDDNPKFFYYAIGWTWVEDQAQ